MNIKILLVNEYGNIRAKPQCENAKLLCDFARIKSFTQDQISALKLLGYNIEFLNEDLGKGRFY